MINTTDTTDFIYPTQGWAHKALFGGIVLGVAIVVGFGMLVYSASVPVRSDNLGYTQDSTQPAVAPSLKQ